MSATEAYRAARDQLLALHGEHARAVAEFRWPEFDGPFNWAVDWFDAYARGNDGTALHIVEEDGRSARYSFDTIVRRSDQVAAWLRSHGVAKGDPVVLMLGNQVELWEAMLAVIKLGAVIMPTTTAPILMTASIDSQSSTWLPSMRITESPRRTPRAASRAATWSERRAISSQEYDLDDSSCSTIVRQERSLPRATASNQSTPQFQRSPTSGKVNSRTARAWSPRRARSWSRAAR